MQKLVSALTGHRLKYAVVLFWIVLAGIAAPLANKLTGAQRNDATSWLPATSESTKVLEAQAAFTSQNTFPAVLVYERDSGLTAADQAKIAADVATFGSYQQLDGAVIGPIPSTDHKAAQVVVPINVGSAGWSLIAPVVDQIKATAATDANGLSTFVTGPAAIATDSSEAFEGIDGTLLYAAVGVVVVILLLTYRSPVLWLLPVMSAGVALFVAQAVIYLLAAHADLTVNAQSAGILTVLVFGAGTDYALLLVARYREELRRHHDRHEAMAVALRRAGPAIIASGATVVIGMLCLLFAETNSTKGLGPVSAIGILVALAVMLTLLPALLVIVGRWVFWPARPVEGSPEPTAGGVWARVGAAVARRPRTTWIATAGVLALMTLGLSQLAADGLTNKESFRGTPASVVGEEALARHFPAGAGNPVVVISSVERASAVRDAFAATTGMVSTTVTPPTTRDGTAFIQGTLADAPDTQAAYDTVDRVRERVHAVDPDAKVGGQAAVQLDVQRAAALDRDLIIPVVLAVVFVILAVLLRAILAPLLLIATVVLSFGAALGLSALVFTNILGFKGADTSLPLFVFVFLVALGIDYNIFLMTRVREEALARGTRRATQVALAATGGVITAAGLVLAGTFSVLATLPMTAFAEIGFAVAIGVLLDTLVVRSILVTALNLDLGPRIWWPSRLASEPDVPTAQVADQLLLDRPAR